MNKPKAKIEGDVVRMRLADYELLMEELEDLRDVAAAKSVEARVRSGESEMLPLALVKRLAKGDNAVRAWRQHRGLSGSALAAEAGLARSYVSELESGRKKGSLRALKEIARVLKVDIADLAR